MAKAGKTVVKAAAAKKPVTKTAKKNIKGDLDALFKNKKSKAITKEKPVKKESKPEKKTLKVEKKKEIKYTKEGYRIYSTEELKIGKGGDTADCPFDCQCCF